MGKDIVVNSTKIKIYLPDEVLDIFKIIKEYGAEAYIVGGSVRDSILGSPINDYDICSPVPAVELEAFFKEKGYTVIPTGLSHGTITVMINGNGYEITTYRLDGKYSDNRHPDNVYFTSDLKEDLRRRDFTINAMAYNDERGLIDPFNGLEDIGYKVIRCVGSAKERFEEDALRILRAIRFDAQLDFTITPDTNYEIHQQYKNLKNISIERINSEFCKIAASNNFCIELLLYKDVFSLFIPELKDMFEFQQNNPYHDYDVFGHTVHAIEHCGSGDMVTRLAVFFHDFGKPHSYQDDEDGVRHFKGHASVSADMTDTVMKRMKFDNGTRENVVELVKYHDATFVANKKNVKRWLNKIGEKQFRRLLDVRAADIMGHKRVFDESRIKVLNSIKVLITEVISENECFSLKDLAVNGNDLISIGYRPGKALGNTLNALLQLVIDGDCPNEKEKLLQEAENLWMERRM